MEAAAEEIMCMETKIFGSVGPVACIEPPKKPAQVAGHARSSDVLRFGGDRCGIGSCTMSVEAAEEEVQCMERSTSGNVRPATCTRPPKRPTQTASYAGVSMGTPGVAALV